MLAGLAMTLAAGSLVPSPRALHAQASTRGLVVRHAWFRTIVPSRPAAGYFTIENTTDSARVFTTATSPACGMLMLHRTVHEQGVERMEPVSRATIPAHGTLSFAPGGAHLMCTAPSPDMQPGKTVSVTFHFADGSALATLFAVRGPGS